MTPYIVAVGEDRVLGAETIAAGGPHPVVLQDESRSEDHDTRGIRPGGYQRLDREEAGALGVPWRIKESTGASVGSGGKGQGREHAGSNKGWSVRSLVWLGHSPPPAPSPRREVLGPVPSLSIPSLNPREPFPLPPLTPPHLYPSKTVAPLILWFRTTVSRSSLYFRRKATEGRGGKTMGATRLSVCSEGPGRVGGS